MPDTQEVPHPTGRNGYEWDAYSDPSQLMDYWNPNIPFHNARQRHVGMDGFVDGIEAPSIKQLPPCRPRWTDVEHYYRIPEVVGYLFAEFFIRKGEIKDATTGKINIKSIGINWWSIAIKIVSAPVVLAAYTGIVKPLAASFGIILP
jgi:hypothetical protein